MNENAMCIVFINIHIQDGILVNIRSTNNEYKEINDM